MKAVFGILLFFVVAANADIKLPKNSKNSLFLTAKTLSNSGNGENGGNVCKALSQGQPSVRGQQDPSKCKSSFLHRNADNDVKSINYEENIFAIMNEGKQISSEIFKQLALLHQEDNEVSLQEVDEVLQKIDERKLEFGCLECAIKKADRVKDVLKVLVRDWEKCAAKFHKDSIELAKDVTESVLEIKEDGLELLDDAKECKRKPNELLEILCYWAMADKVCSYLEDTCKTISELQDQYITIRSNYDNCVKSAKNKAVEKCNDIYDDIKKCLNNDKDRK